MNICEKKGKKKGKMTERIFMESDGSREFQYVSVSLSLYFSSHETFNEHIPLDNITEKNELIFAGAKLVGYKIGIL